MCLEPPFNVKRKSPLLRGGRGWCAVCDRYGLYGDDGSAVGHCCHHYGGWVLLVFVLPMCHGCVVIEEEGYINIIM